MTSRNAKHLLDDKNQSTGYIAYYLFTDAHDRFIIIANQDIYHLGASLKDLGKKMVRLFENAT
ncbi:hypothetical protein P8S54_00560 [Thiomicrospira sp. R3]|uniref:hypothetical protein n=1 Tax=Thiomicrospira sp. R3 TaxID=3035472 RepID=UPI00259B4D29|nr:hypothetical protein [Thiomicrospira sp. R3]WFE68823.1 hypothetical protein P8S54_00560 [Thiomicrospira sp. R3]